MNDQPNFYAIIPATVRYDSDLIPNAKLLYAEITALCRAEGYCWASNKYFARIFGVSNETVSRWISQLSEKEYLFISYDADKGNVRQIAVDYNVQKLLIKNAKVLTKSARGMTKNASTPCGNNQVPLDEKRKQNNIINNIINREATALEFLSVNFPSAYEVFEMQYKSKITDWDRFVDDFNCKVIEEKREFEQAILFARLKRLANNWINRQQQPEHGKVVEISKNHPSLKKLG